MALRERVKNPQDTKQKIDPAAYLKTGPIDIVKHRLWYIGVSVALLIPGLAFIVLSMMTTPNHSPVHLGIDFTGGTILEYAFEKNLTQADIPRIHHIFDQKGYTGSVIQLETPPGKAGIEKHSADTLGVSTGFEKNTAEKPSSHWSSTVSIRTKPLAKGDHAVLENALEQEFGSLTLLQKNAIGPALASELLINASLALLFAYILIVGYLTIMFQFDYAMCAIIALVHDTLFVIGIFAGLGYFFHVEVDSLFITAILTVVGFSVHDTIVVFDRIRENTRVLYSKKLPFSDIANLSINQTLARSINTSVTVLLTLFTLYFLGGETTKNFILAIILGIIVGTYSSIFVASAMLTWWREGKSLADTSSSGLPA